MGQETRSLAGTRDDRRWDSGVDGIAEGGIVALTGWQLAGRRLCFDPVIMTSIGDDPSAACSAGAMSRNSPC